MAVISNVGRGEWVDQNPLRRWRKQHTVSIMAAAQLASVSTSSIQKWEAGATVPTDDSMTTLASLMEVTPRTLASRWKRWYDDRPGVK